MLIPNALNSRLMLPGTDGSFAMMKRFWPAGYPPVDGGFLLFPEDLTNPVWVAGGGSFSITEGIDDPNSNNYAFTLTATAANTFFQQTFNDALGATKTYAYSIYMRRRTGTGLISLDTRAGRHYVNSLINNSTYTLVTNFTSPATGQIGVGTAPSPTNYYAIKIDTSGDAIDIYLPHAEIV